MEKSPPEILNRVFQLACTDDGSTGRALSFVSTRIRSISAPHKYYSLEIRGVERITDFAFFLEEYHAPVQYLKLDCTPTHWTGEDVDVELLLRSSRMLSTNATTILRVLAPNLRGLFFIPAAAQLNLAENWTILPLLETLYLYDNYYDIPTKLDWSHFPFVKRINVSCDTSIEHRQPFTFRGIRPPSLTHFGCCSNGEEGVWDILYSLALSNKAGVTPSTKDIELDKLLALDVLRVQVPSVKLPVLYDIIEGTKLIEEFPVLLAKEHNPSVEEVELIKEWRYVVEGGEGFQLP